MHINFMRIDEESKVGDNHKSNYIQEFTPDLPLRLSNLTREDNQKILIKHLNMDLSVTFPIQQGLSLSQSSLEGLPPKFWENIKIFRETSFQPMALIFADYLKEQHTKHIKVCNISPHNGIYCKVVRHPIPVGLSKFGLPAGENTILIERTTSNLTITLKKEQHTYKLDEGWKNVMFVKTRPKKLEEGDQHYNFLELGPSDDTSRRHATLQMCDGELFMVDGTIEPPKKSTNGVFVYLSQSQPKIMLEDESYVLGDFRIALKLQKAK